MLNRREFLTALTCLPLTSYAAETKPRCSICGMFVVDKAAISFEGQRDGKPVPFCSFSCAHAFHRKYPESALLAFDYVSHTALPVEKAFYVIKSEKLASEFKLAMAPVVIAFAKESDAKAAKERVKEGEVVAGFAAVAKVFGR